MVTRVAHPLQVACSRWPPLCIRTTYRLLVLLYAYVPPTCAPLCKDKRVCQSIETSAHAFSICTCRPLMTLRLVRLPNLPAPNLRERLFFTKDPKGASNIYQSVLEYQPQMQEENCKMHKFGGGKNKKIRVE